MCLCTKVIKTPEFSLSFVILVTAFCRKDPKMVFCCCEQYCLCVLWLQSQRNTTLMFLKVVYVTETSVAHHAPEWVITHVVFPMVCVKITGLTKRLSALLTFVWLLSRVHYHVSAQTFRSTKHLVAHMTTVRVLFSVLHSVVHYKNVCHCEPFAANIALVWFRSWMTPPVYRQIFTAFTTSATFCALISTRVDIQMLTKSALRRVTFLTPSAWIPVVSSVRWLYVSVHAWRCCIPFPTLWTHMWPCFVAAINHVITVIVTSFSLHVKRLESYQCQAQWNGTTCTHAQHNRWNTTHYANEYIVAMTTRQTIDKNKQKKNYLAHLDEQLHGGLLFTNKLLT